MVSVGFITGFMVGLEFHEDEFFGSKEFVVDLGIVRIIWEYGFE